MGYVDFTPFGATALSDGNYVVLSPFWDNKIVVDVGAVTWGNGQVGATGDVSLTNSLRGAWAGDRIGYTDGNFGVVALKNGHYVVCSPRWDNGEIVDAGAATWMNGGGVETGTISAANSMTGVQAEDNVALDCVIALTNGHYVISSANWDNGIITDAGAATWVDGFGPGIGVVTAGNSLVGSHPNDNIGRFYSNYGKLLGIRPLPNGNYVVTHRDWDNGNAVDAGAITWRNGTGGFRLSFPRRTRSLARREDLVGSDLEVFGNSEYLVRSNFWSQPDAGAMTYAPGEVAVTGTVNAVNSLVPATQVSDFDHDSTRGYLVASFPDENRIVIVRLDGIFMDGLEGTITVVSQ